MRWLQDTTLEELRLDYEDFLRQRTLPLWQRDDPRKQTLIARRCTTADQVAEWLREQHDNPSIESTESIRSMKSTYPELAANAALILLGVACTLLDRQLATLATAFTEEGGFTERLYRLRTQRRKQQ